MLARHIVPAALLTPIFCGDAQAQTSVTWIGPAIANWNNGANWSGGVVPRNGTPPGSTYHAFIDGGGAQNSVVNLDFFNSLTNLSTSAGDELSTGTFILGFASPIVARTINNAGTIRALSGGGILINTSTYSIGGGGTILLQNGNILDNNNGEKLTNINNLISGSGTINGAMAFTNHGTIRANIGAQNLTMSVGQGFNQIEWINDGTLEAAGGRLRIAATAAGFGALQNAGGTISCGNNSAVTFGDELRVFGGTLTTSGNGKFGLEGVAPFFPSHRAEIGSLTLAGHFQIDATTTLGLSGPIVNNGTITINGSGSNAVLRIAGNGVTLSGGGFVRLNSINGGTASFGNLAVTNFDNTFIGAGSMGDGYCLVNNAGTITASGGTMTVTGTGVLFPEPSGINFISSGTMSAQSGATMVLAPVGTHAFDCSAGTFLVDGTLRVNAKTLAGRINGPGTVVLGASTNLSATHLRVGSLSIGSGATLSINTGGGTLGTSVLQKTPSISGGRFDLKDHDLIVANGDGTPLNDVAALLASGYAGGSWNGIGINSSSAAASTTPKTALGYARAADLFGGSGTFSGQNVASGAVLVKYTLSGDANLDGVVNALDFNALASNFGGAGKFWVQGDFNFDGQTNSLDFAPIASNFNFALPSPPALATLVPEPAVTLLLTGIGLIVSLPRHRRGSWR